VRLAAQKVYWEEFYIILMEFGKSSFHLYFC
jgi:hypothetical protein